MILFPRCGRLTRQACPTGWPLPQAGQAGAAKAGRPRPGGRGRAERGWVVTPVIGVPVLAIPIRGDLRPGQPAPYSYLPWLTIALIAAGVVYMLILSTVRPRVIEYAVANLEGEVERRPPRCDPGARLTPVIPDRLPTVKGVLAPGRAAGPDLPRAGPAAPPCRLRPGRGFGGVRSVS
jgi:hypothetical protein